jgi:hypothetical protein
MRSGPSLVYQFCIGSCSGRCKRRLSTGKGRAYDLAVIWLVLHHQNAEEE